MKTFPVGAFQCNCTIIADPATGDAIVIDPGDEFDKINRVISENQFTVRYIVHTHAHLDHIGATYAVKEKCGGKVCLNKHDLFLYENISMQARLLGLPLDDRVPPVEEDLTHGLILECHPEFKSQVLFTPGHTPGSVCFLFSDIKLGDKSHHILFSGDTLFAGSIGRTDLWGGDYDQIISSIKEKLLTLPGETVIVSGHGPQTTIAREAKLNPFLQ